MEKSIKMLFDAFQATFAVSTQMRPDGGALLTLRNGEEIVTRRVVSAAQLARYVVGFLAFTVLAAYLLLGVSQHAFLP